MKDDPDMTHAVIHSFNEWIYETWTFDYQDRIFATPVITLPIVEKAIEELEWVVERGARVILIRPAPVPGLRGSRSFALPEFDPFWEKVVQHDLLVALHSSDSGYERYTNDWLGSNSEMLPFVANAFRMVGQWRPVEDTVASLICHGANATWCGSRISVCALPGYCGRLYTRPAESLAKSSTARHHILPRHCLHGARVRSTRAIA